MKPKRTRGRPPKLGEYQAFVLRLPITLHKELLRIAQTQGKSLNDLLVQITQEWKDAQSKDAPE